jgi:penicillin-binding protein 2
VFKHLEHLRGLLYDRNKTPLVKNIPNYEVTVIPSDLPKEAEEREKVYQRLSETIEMKTEEIKKIVDSREPYYTQPLLISNSVDRETSLIFESRQSELKGFYVGINPIREYLDNGLLAHVLGYVGRISEKELADNKEYKMTDFIGKSGLESVYEKILKGVDGKERIEVDSSGEIIRTYGQENPILGDNMMLTIDFELQKKLTEEMTRQMTLAKVKKGSAVAVNPENGEILAMVSLPTYDNNLFAKGISEKDYAKLLNDENFPLVNRVTSGEYPSGSTIKPFLAASALDAGTITEKTTILSNWWD